MDNERNAYIRSFVRRQGKMTKAQRESLEHYKTDYCLTWTEGYLIDLTQIFPDKTTVVLEIGFGMGISTAIIAEKNPQIAYLGVEVHTPGVGKLLWEINHRGLQNIRIYHGDVVPFITSGLAENSLNGIHIFFPDPWPKKKHHKRRLLNQEFSSVLSSRVKPGGYIYIATDWEDYAIQILESFSQIKDLYNPFTEFANTLNWRPETVFEKKGKKANRIIREIFFKKKEGPI